MIEESKELVKSDGGKQFLGHDAYWRETKKCPIKCSKSETDNTVIRAIDVNHECENGKTAEQFHEQAICELTGTANKEIGDHIVLRGVLALCGDNAPEKQNIILQTLAEYQPRDQHEARLCVQSTALYDHGMKYLHQAEANKRFDQSEFYLKNATKLLRLHNETIEALSKYRRGGTQNVVVQHVQVNDGGQAIVGNTIGGGVK
jgi:hypothetical protein